MPVKVYTVSGFHNGNYAGIFCHLFDSHQKMRLCAEEMMATDMGLTHEEFIDLFNKNRESFDEQFLDGAGRTFEECLEDGAYYSDNGFEIAFGEEEVK